MKIDAVLWSTFKTFLLTAAAVTLFVIALAVVPFRVQRVTAPPTIPPTPPPVDLPPPRATVAELDELWIELHTCLVRTDSLRHAMQQLIKEWPWPGGGRAELPMPPAGWPPWPTPGITHRWRKGGWE